MRYTDIKIIEKEAKGLTSFGYDGKDLFKLVITVDTQTEKFSVDKVPYSFLRQGKEKVYKAMTDFILQNYKNIDKSFKILAIQAVDKKGKEMPITDLFPSNDGDKNAQQDKGYKIIAGVITYDPEKVSKIIKDYKEFIKDDSQTEWEKDSKALDYDKDRLKELFVLDTRHDKQDQVGALVDPATGTAVGAIKGTPAEKTMREYMRKNPGQKLMVGVVAPGGDAGKSGEGKSGKEGESGATEGQKAIVPEIIDEVKAGLEGLGTSEARIIRALKRIETPAHFKEVIIAYKEKFGVPIGNDILNDIKYDPEVPITFVRELSRIFSMIGFKIYRHPNSPRTLRFGKKPPSPLHYPLDLGDE